MKLIPSTGDSAAHPSGLGLLVGLRHKSEAVVAIGGPSEVAPCRCGWAARYMA